MYEAATIEDVHLAYEHLKVNEESLFACVGVAGSQAGEDINGKCYQITKNLIVVSCFEYYLVGWNMHLTIYSFHNYLVKALIFSACCL